MTPSSSLAKTYTSPRKAHLSKKRQPSPNELNRRRFVRTKAGDAIREAGKLDALEAAALQLPLTERAHLAERLLVSFEDGDEILNAWIAEAERRAEAHTKGDTTSMLLEQAMVIARAGLVRRKLSCSRKRLPTRWRRARSFRNMFLTLLWHSSSIKLNAHLTVLWSVHFLVHSSHPFCAGSCFKVYPVRQSDNAQRLVHSDVV